MARARNIKPGFFTNDMIAEMTPWARLTFIGLWTLADKAGRMLYRPKKIKMELFPGDNIDVEPLIEELIEHGFVEVYETDGITVLSVINFSKHQNPHPKEKESELPPKKPGESTIRENKRQAAESNGPAAKRPDPAVLIPDVLIPDSGCPDTKNGAAAPDVVVPPPSKAPGYTDEFEAFWSEWPKGKGNKKKAFDQWKRLRPDADLQAVIRDRVQAWKKTRKWQQGYITHAERWLRDRGWEDDLPDEPAPGAMTIHNGGITEIRPGPRGYTMDQLRQKAEMERLRESS